MSAAAPATSAAEALVPFTVPKLAAPGSEVASETPGATSSGFTRPSKASPVDENAATWPRSGFAELLGRPIATPTPAPSRRASRIVRAVASDTSTTGIDAASSSPSEPLGSSPP